MRIFEQFLEFDEIFIGGENVELLPLAEVEKRHVKHVLDKLGGNRQEAAEVLEIHRTTLYKKIEAYGLA